METTLYKVKFEDGRMYKVFCANKKQKQRMFQSMWNLSKATNKKPVLTILENGIHDIKQWEQIIANE